MTKISLLRLTNIGNQLAKASLVAAVGQRLIPLFTCVLLVLTSSVQAQVTGTVFRDYNANGTYQSIPLSGTYSYGEPGVAGITVVATTSTTSFTTTSSSTGSYTFTNAQLPSGTAVRLQFSGFSATNFDFDGGQLATGGTTTSIQFVTAGTSTTANFGFNYPGDYCQTFAQTTVVTSCFNASAVLTDGAIVEFAPSEISDPARPFVNGVTTISAQFSLAPTMTKRVLANQAQVGTVNGFAYHRRSKILFAAAFARTASPVRNGLGAIYAINLSSPTPTTAVFATVANVGALIGGVVSQTNVGKVGLGNIALSEDERTLYAINLNARTLVSIPLGAGTPTAGTATTVAIPGPADCTVDYRPFAIRVHRGKIYIGITCGSGTEANLKGYVYEYNGSTFTTVLTIPFTYPRADDGVSETNSSDANYYGFNTYPTYIRNNMGWVDWNTYPVLDEFPTGPSTASTTGAGPRAKTQPWLTDIAFDGSDMILGVRSRLADAVNLSTWVVGGDILRACSVTPGSWTLESNGVCGGVRSFVGTAPPTTDPYTTSQRVQGNSRGPGGYEYYWGDDGFEGEASQGSVLQLPGSPNVIVTQVDVVGHTGQVGVMSMSNKEGRVTAAGNVFYGYNTDGTSSNNIGKSNGLGGLEATCNPAPIEIGNRAWIDTDKDGIQDPGELPLAGLVVQLFAPNGTTPLATTVTDNNGLYVFRSTSTTALTYNTAYQIRIPASQTALTGYAFTVQNQGTNDLIDSDFVPGTTTATLSLTTGGIGQNNFTFDIGIIPCSFTAITRASSSNVCVNQSILLTTQVSPSGSYTYSVAAPAGVIVTGGNTATATVSNLTTGVNNFTVTILNGPTCFTTNVVSVTASATPLITLTASQSAVCLGQPVTLAVSGVPLGGVVTYGTLGPLGTLLSPTTSPVFSPTATTTYTASVSVLGIGGLTTILTSCPLTVSVNQPPVLLPISLSLCAGTVVNLNSLSGLSGLTNVFRTGLVTGLGTQVSSPTTVTIATGTNQFNVVSTNPAGCTATAPISITGVAVPALSPISLSLCAGSVMNLNSLTGLSGLTNVFRTGSLLGSGTLVGSPTAVTIGTGVNLFNVVSTNPAGCTAATPISVTGVAVPTLSPISLSLCAGTVLNLTSLSGLSGLTNVFRTGSLLGSGTLVTSPTTVTISSGVNLFNVVSTNPAGCTAAAPISITGVAVPALSPISLSLCAGSVMNLNSLTGLSGLTNVFRTGSLLGSGTLVSSPTAVTISTGANLFNVVSTNPSGCTAATPISVTGVAIPVLSPINLSLCVGTTLDLTSLSGLSGLTNVFRTGSLLGLGTLVTSPTMVTVGTGVNLFNVVSTNPSGCTAATRINVTGIALPALSPSSLSLCAGVSLDLTTLIGASGLTNVFRTGSLLGQGSLISTPTAVTIAAGENLFNVVSTGTFGCTAAAPISVTGVDVPVTSPINLSLCADIGTPVNLSAILASNGSVLGLTSIFRLGGIDGSVIANPENVSLAVGSNLFNVVSTNPTGCTIITPIQVTLEVKPVLSIAATIQSQTVCEGATPLPITATVISGTVASSAFYGPLVDIASPLGTAIGTGLSYTPTSAQLPAPGETVYFALVADSSSSCSDVVYVALTTAPLPTVTTTSLSICLGESVDLRTRVTTEAGATSAFFTTFSNAQSLLSPLTSTTVTPTLTTPYFTRVTSLLTGCFSIEPIQVTVKPKPDLVASQTLVCGPLGQAPTSATLTASPTGGTWSNTPGNPSLASFTTNAASTTVGGLVAGTYQFDYTADGCTATTSVVVPTCEIVCAITLTANAASSTVAEGQPAYLSATVAPAGSYTYVWSAPAGVTITSTNSATATTAGLASGIYTFTVTATNEVACTQVATVCVTVPFTVCAGSDYAFSLTTVAGFNTYQWQYTAPGSATSTVVQSSSANSYIATQAGEYRVVILDNAGSSCPGNSCCPLIIVERSAPVSLSVTALAATCSSTAPAAQNNAQLVLAAPVVSGATYNISPGATFSAANALFATNQSLAGLTTGSVLQADLVNPATATGDTYTVRVFTAEGCFADTVVTIPRTDCDCPPVKCVPFMVRKVATNR
ncbi:SdrD B-like domain-containing protein [Fibrivirga algicola]|uniref:PKD/Chitinase domain-containing protein n=1 Tax=Fibrivirga algicola TaxID=2950420 RepID=A0ABX0QJH7_9BACT|nr:SdrD B-like domain-containing protein [Fibrivirga algicola]NID12610.1 hypothetical protein [Fibrivirga algicola]